MAKSLYSNGDIEIRLEKTHSIVSQNLLFFHSNEFITRKKGVTPLLFNLYKSEKQLISIAFEIVNNTAISLVNSPFGGFINTVIPDTFNVDDFLHVIIRYFREKELSIQIKLAPDIYNSSQNEIHAILMKKHFLIQYQDTNQHVKIDERSFSKKINRNRARKLALCISKDYLFKALNTSVLGQAHDLITECREEKGYPVTMTLSELKVAFNTFPDRYFLFGVFCQSEMVATAVSIKVNDKILYNFYHGDRLSHRQNSPVTLLVAGIYDYCQQQQFEILDLGISSDQGALNEGLYYFKKSCGAISSDKKSYQT